MSYGIEVEREFFIGEKEYSIQFPIGEDALKEMKEEVNQDPNSPLIPIEGFAKGGFTLLYRDEETGIEDLEVEVKIAIGPKNCLWVFGKFEKDGPKTFQETIEIPEVILGKGEPIRDGEDFYQLYQMVSYDGREDVWPISAKEEVFKRFKNNPKKVWTLIDGDDGNQWCCAGFKYVNRFGFIITEEEWDSEDEEYLENNTFKIL